MFIITSSFAVHLSHAKSLGINKANKNQESARSDRDRMGRDDPDPNIEQRGVEQIKGVFISLILLMTSYIADI